jgi:hypothetical protein
MVFFEHSCVCPDIHGDLTESNIFLCKDDQVVKLADFKDVEAYKNRNTYQWHKARLIDIYDVIGSIIHISEYQCNAIFHGRKDNVLDYLKEVQEQLESIKCNEFDCMTEEVKRLICVLHQKIGVESIVKGVRAALEDEAALEAPAKRA